MIGVIFSISMGTLDQACSDVTEWSRIVRVLEKDPRRTQTGCEITHKQRSANFLKNKSCKFKVDRQLLLIAIYVLFISQ